MNENQEQTEELNTDDENIQLAENKDIDKYDENSEIVSYYEKRKMLEKTKIVKQTWSIIEIFQKINDGKVILDPEYQ